MGGRVNPDYAIPNEPLIESPDLRQRMGLFFGCFGGTMQALATMATELVLASHRGPWTPTEAWIALAIPQLILAFLILAFLKSRRRLR